MPSWLCEGISPSGTGASSQVCDDPRDWRYSRAELGQTNGVGSCTAQGGCGSAYYDGGEAFAIQLSQWVGQKTHSSANSKKMQKILDLLVDGDSASASRGYLVSGHNQNEMDPWQMNFENSAGNAFNVTGCDASGTCTTVCKLSCTINFQACPMWETSEFGYMCEHCTDGFALLSQNIALLTNMDACDAWFVKADIALRMLIENLRAYWVTDRIKLCASNSTWLGSGCYVKLGSGGCPGASSGQQAQLSTTELVLDPFDSPSDEASCLARKATYEGWCAATSGSDIKIAWVPS